ncbi:MAG: HAD family hydrolase [Leptolyngbyaceae cyanobacterium]
MKNSPVLLQESSCSPLQPVQLVASDMDGTLTQQSKFAPLLLQSLAMLSDLSITVLIVTGRSAGWVQGVAHYLPVAGAIAENGGIFITPETGTAVPLVDLPDIAHHRQQLADMFRVLQTKFPDLQPSTDNDFRLTDWTFDIGNLTSAALTHIAEICSAAGWGFTYSTVQCHIRPLAQDKGVGLQQVLRQYFSQVSERQVVTVGDSLNDEGLFDASRFPLSVGVANVAHYGDRLQHLPAFITKSNEVQGFWELTQALEQLKKSA